MKCFTLIHFLFLCNLKFADCAKKKPEDLLALQKALQDAKERLKSLENLQGSDEMKAMAWASIAMNLQMQDAIWHNGGVEIQQEALLSFDKAIELTDAGKKDLLVQLHQNKGILLKMMGRGKESLESHDKSFSLADSRFDKSSALYSKGDTLGMMGLLDQAVDSYKEAIKLRPDHISVYLPLVKVLREQNKTDKKSWRRLMSEMKSAVKKYRKITEKFASDNEASALYRTNHRDEVGHVKIPPDIYWALFEVEFLA